MLPQREVVGTAHKLRRACTQAATVRTRTATAPLHVHKTLEQMFTALCVTLAEGSFYTKIVKKTCNATYAHCAPNKQLCPHPVL